MPANAFEVDLVAPPPPPPNEPYACCERVSHASDIRCPFVLHPGIVHALCISGGPVASPLACSAEESYRCVGAVLLDSHWHFASGRGRWRSCVSQDVLLGVACGCASRRAEGWGHRYEHSTAFCCGRTISVDIVHVLWPQNQEILRRHCFVLSRPSPVRRSEQTHARGHVFQGKRCTNIVATASRHQTPFEQQCDTEEASFPLSSPFAMALQKTLICPQMTAVCAHPRRQRLRFGILAFPVLCLCRSPDS